MHGQRHFETHLTVVCPDTGTDRLVTWAATRGLGFTHIVLARGRTPSQPMLNLTGEGSADAQIRQAARIAAELTADGFRVARIKTEAVPWAAGVPQDDAAAAVQDSARYFEHHVKLLLPAIRDRTVQERESASALADVAAPHGAHVSWNARRVRPDAQEERFITQRCHGVGRATAEQRLSALLDDLHTAAFHVLEVEREFVLHDTNLDLDDGWITQEPPR